MNDLELKLGLEKLKQEWKPRGFKCKIYKTNSEESWSNPGHTTDEYLILIEGKIEISFQGKTHCPGVGEIFKIPADTPHKSRYGESSCLYWIYAFDWQWNKDGTATEEGNLRSQNVKSV